ncbi:MAG TPA: hypothetical protein VGB75_04320 [Jatrophihabitans sp.]|uniref:hypothetical protein n=1 Tax=Jatrophihabitans sp. TaxID=1932789 RepID=UPI002EFEC6BA
MTDQDDGLHEAVESRREELIADKSGFIGECRETVPFGEMFYVFAGGKEYMSCTHTPPHTHPA